jgi:alpha-galactosidase
MAVKVEGKSSGWTGPVNEYVKNKGSVGQKKIVFVGASYKFVHRVLRDMMLVGGFNDCHLVVHDIDEVPMKIVGDLLERMARQKETNIKVSRTLDRREALKGADAVILSITIGGKETDYRSFEVCAKYGIPVGIGDTMGPAALARNLRTVPFVVQLVKEMEELCPEGVLLNFTNPMSVLTGAAARHSSILTYGLCHSADEMYRYFAQLFACKKDDVELELGGVNHQAFVTKLKVKGVDRTREILDASIASNVKLEDSLLGHKEDVNLQQEICRLLGVWPSTGADHLAEFYQYFYTPRRLESLKFHAIKTIQPGRQPFGRTPCPQIIEDWAHGPEAVGDLHLLTEEHAHELMWSIFSGEPFTRVLNVLNSGEFVRGIPRTACVEVVTTTQGKKFSAVPLTLPVAAHSLVQRWCAIHDLTIKAALECDRDAARQALFLDAHTQDMYDIDPMLEDFLKALEPWLPRGWYKRQS